MSIARVTVRVIERDMGGRSWNPRMRWSRKQILLAFVETADGKVGVGEAWVTGGTPRAIQAVIEDDIAPLLVGEEPFVAARIGRALFRGTEMSNRTGAVACAWAAVETALMDLQGKLLGRSLGELLGRTQDSIFAYASAGLYGEGKGPDQLAAEVRGWVDRGFTAVKIKVGGASLVEDVRRVAAVREAIGPETQLMVDALYNLDVAEAIAMARALEPYGIHFLEAPVSPHDVEGQALVAAAAPMPVAGNETLAWVAGFKRLIEARAVHFVQFDIAACGGVAEGRRIGELAMAHHLPCTLHAASSCALFAASLQLASALPNCVSIEYHMMHQWLWDLVPAGLFDAVGGRVAVPTGDVYKRQR